MNYYISSISLLTALGASPAQILRRVLAGDGSSVKEDDSFGKRFLLAAIERPLQKAGYPLLLQNYLSLCYEKLRGYIEELKKRFGEERIAVVIGSSNCGIEETFNNLKGGLNSGSESLSVETLEIGAPSEFLAEYAGVYGPAYTVSTACSSSAKAFKSARSLIRANLADAVVVGGVDNLCCFAVNGFDALEALSSEHSAPFDKNRSGINIGESCALAILSPIDLDGEGIRLAGIGESSDAVHITAPAPTGEPAIAAIKAALDDAGITPQQIDYINLHGTGTIANDIMESAAINALFGEGVYASSTKPITGHTLGASGAVEIAICCLLLSSLNKEHLLPPHNYSEYDRTLKPIRLVDRGVKVERLSYCLSNSFAFGGSNTAVVVGR
ncbi:MAG: beta-ketoacyl-ACP synthase [Deferribacteraceae bacterium]|jgi:3-oxoacyl-[acyl-carrier-protein] synthase-1|nr:beta-ketoacyl-ACP synthase [Deferribacteraceae bacterium]